MARYIDTDKAIAHLKGECVEKYPASFYNGILASAKEISDLPTADVVERKRGEWKKSSHPILGTHFDCSVCKCEWYVDGMRIDDDVNLAFCPNCGADMRGEKE